MTQYNNILEAIIGHTPLIKLNKIIHGSMPEKTIKKRNQGQQR
jgi:hypothetical protein